jgi:hypothetical protein
LESAQAFEKVGVEMVISLCVMELLVVWLLDFGEFREEA